MRPGSLTESRGIFEQPASDDSLPESEESLIDAKSSFDGLFQVGNHLRIEGLAKGEIQCQGTLTVAEGATVTAKITAVNVVVAGVLNGEIICRERLQILPSGRVSGTVTTGSLVIQEGALYEGELRMRTAPAEQPQPAVSQPPTPPARAGNASGRNRGANGRNEAPPPEEN